MSSNEASVLFDAIQNKRWSDSLRILQDENERRKAQCVGKGRTGGEKWNILHWACYHNETPIEIVQLLLDSFPFTAIGRECINGYTPLHFAIDNSSHEFIEVILKTCPEAAAVEDIEGYTPLHSAVQDRDTTVEVIRELLAGDTSLIFKANKGETPFHCFLKQWNMTLRNKKEIFDDTTAPSVILDLDIGDDGTKMYEIYDKTCVVLKAASICLSKDKPSSSSNLAVHNAARIGFCPWAFFRLLLKIHPEQVSQKDSDGNLPIHVVAGSTDSFFSDGDLYKCCECDSKLSKTSWYNYEIADEIICQDCFFHFFLDSDFDFDFDEADKAAFFDFVQPVRKVLTVIHDLLKLNPHAASVLNNEGRLALNIAIESGKKFEEGIKDILRAAPEAIRTRDMKTHLLPFMLAAVEQKPSIVTNGDEMGSINAVEESMHQLTNIFLLLKEDPSLVSIGIPKKVLQ